MPRTVLAMSGGVDSSVAAILLREAGHDVVGVFMRHGEESAQTCRTAAGEDPLLPLLEQRQDHKQGCCSAADAEDARRVADRLEIPFYALNLQRDFARIIEYFVQEYAAARTPNPCIACNNWIKFGRLFHYADSIGADYVATGHYARVQSDGGDCRLYQGVDVDKDQSYVLFGVARRLLPRMLLPIGGFRKSQIRALAGQVGLDVAEKRDSQEICFVTSGHHSAFVQQRRGASQPGEIVTTAGHVVGRHAGIEAFTVGQRKGLKVALGEPYFVVRIEPDSARVVIGRRDELARRELTADRCNWLADPPKGAFRCLAKIRYNAQPAAATAGPLTDGRLRVHFDEPLFGVSPGQAVVCYDADRSGRVLGGGWIQ